MAFYLIRAELTTRWVLERGGVVYAVGRSTHRTQAEREFAIVRDGRAPPGPERVADGWVIVFRDMAGNEMGRGLEVHPTMADCVKECIQAMRPEQTPRRARATV